MTRKKYPYNEYTNDIKSLKLRGKKVCGLNRIGKYGSNRTGCQLKFLEKWNANSYWNSEIKKCGKQSDMQSWWKGNHMQI